jgi:hypothetical protein
MGLNFSAPHLTGDIARAGERAGERAGAEATANLLRIVESRHASALIALLGAYTLYTVAVGLRREFGGAKPPVELSVLHRNERAPPPPPAAAAATPAAP